MSTSTPQTLQAGGHRWGKRLWRLGWLILFAGALASGGVYLNMDYDDVPGRALLPLIAACFGMALVQGAALFLEWRSRRRLR